MNRLLAVSSVSLVAFLTSCQTTIPVRSLQPGLVPVGATNHIVMVKGEGRRSAREDVAQQVINQCRKGGHFSVEDRTESPIFVRVAGGQVYVEGGNEAFEGAAIAGLKIDVLDMNTESDVQAVQHVDAKGNQSTREETVHCGHVLLGVTMFDGQGRTYLAETEFSGEAYSRDNNVRRDELLGAAMAEAVQGFLATVTPRAVVTNVRLDDDDDGQAAILETAKAGNIAQAAKDAEAYVDNNPTNPAAAYNLAVFLDAMGNYEQAMAWYDQAMKLGNKGFYSSARAQCARRLSDWQSLQTAVPSR